MNDFVLNLLLAFGYFAAFHLIYLNVVTIKWIDDERDNSRALCKIALALLWLALGLGGQFNHVDFLTMALSIAMITMMSRDIIDNLIAKKIAVQRWWFGVFNTILGKYI